MQWHVKDILCFRFCIVFMPWLIIIHNASHAMCYLLRRWKLENFAFQLKYFVFPRLSVLICCSQYSYLPDFTVAVFNATHIVSEQFIIFSVEIIIRWVKVDVPIWKFENFVTVIVCVRSLFCPSPFYQAQTLKYPHSKFLSFPWKVQ